MVCKMKRNQNLLVRQLKNLKIMLNKQKKKKEKIWNNLWNYYQE